MSLRIRLGVLLFAVLALAAIWAGISADYFLHGNLKIIEDTALRENLKRVDDLLADNLSSLSSQTGDWAGWDESCEFVETGNPAFIKRNLPDKTFAELRLNVIMFVQPSGRPVFERWYDQKQGKTVPAPVSFRKHCGPNSRLLSHSYASSSQGGMILLPEGPLMVVSRPIVTTERTGPIKGVLIMGRFLDAVEIDRLSKAARISFDVARTQDPQMPAEFANVQPLLQQSDTVYRFINDKEAAGFGMVKDIYGEPALMVKTVIPRIVHIQWTKGFNSYAGAMAAGYLLLAVTTLAAIRLLVPSSAVNGNAAAETEPGIVRGPSAGAGDTELASLLNNMKDSAERNEAAFLLRAFDSAPAGFYAADTEGTILKCNSAFARMLGYSSPGDLLSHREASLYQTEEAVIDITAALAEKFRIEVHEVEFADRIGREMKGIQRVWGFFDADGELVRIEGCLQQVIPREGEPPS